jgi:hypothetical protein
MAHDRRRAWPVRLLGQLGARGSNSAKANYEFAAFTRLLDPQPPLYDKAPSRCIVWALRVSAPWVWGTALADDGLAVETFSAVPNSTFARGFAHPASTGNPSAMAKVPWTDCQKLA